MLNYQPQGNLLAWPKSVGYLEECITFRDPAWLFSKPKAARRSSKLLTAVIRPQPFLYSYNDIFHRVRAPKVAFPAWPIDLCIDRAMAPTNQNESQQHYSNLNDRILDHEEDLVHSPHEDDATERTGLLWKHNSDGSVSDTLHEGDLDGATDVEAAREYDMEHMPWLQKAVFYMTVRSGFLTMLPFWILITFLFVTLR